MANRWGKMEAVTDFIFSGSKITVDSDCSCEIKRHLFLGRKAVTNIDSLLKSRDITLPTKVYSQSYGSSSSHVRMRELDHKEGWVPKNWCFGTVVLEEILDSPLESKEIKPVNSKGNQPWILSGRTNAPILWPPNANSRLIGKDLDAGKDRRQKEKRVTEDEMVGWHHRFNGCELGQIPADGD